jgi:hypothetical protein
VDTATSQQLLAALAAGSRVENRFPARSARNLPLGISFASDYSADYIQEKLL